MSAEIIYNTLTLIKQIKIKHKVYKGDYYETEITIYYCYFSSSTDNLTECKRCKCLQRR